MNAVQQITIIFLVFLASISAHAQQGNVQQGHSQQDDHTLEDQSISGLKIGDKVTDTILSRIIRYPKAAVKISEFKDKLLILDFWDTNCGSCIELMPKMDSLQNQFRDQIKILPVTYQEKAVISRFFNTNKYVKAVKLSCIVEDKVLHTYFPHKTISHLVWIYKGVVKAITSSQYLDAKNIQMLLDEKQINWPVKTDVIEFDYNKPFALANPAKTGQPFFKEYIKGVERNTGTVTSSVPPYTRLYYVNYTLLDMFYNLWSKIQPHRFIPHPGRRVLEVKDPSTYIYDEKKDDIEQWCAKNVICYERFFKTDSLSKADYYQVMKDLSEKFKLNCRYEKRMAKCLIISPIKGKPVARITTTSGLKKQKIGLIAFWLDYSYKYPPVIDESRYTLPIPIGDWNNNLELLRRELNKNGFDIKEEMRELDQLVLTKLR